VASNEKTGRAPLLRASEKVLLHLLRLHGAMSKAELARLSGMSAQGVSIIVERLLDLDLVCKGEKMRGRVGQPSTPIILNPAGAVALGICIDSHDAKLVVTNFQGGVLCENTVSYDRARDDTTPERIMDAALKLPDAVGPDLWKRRVGVGIAARESLIDFFAPGEATTSPAAPVLSLAARLEQEFDVPAYCVNDIQAACIAELSIGSGDVEQSLLYFDMGLSLGTGIILEGRLIGSEARLSSSLHFLPLAGRNDMCVGDLASLAPLRRSVGRDGFDFMAQLADDFADTQPLFRKWQGEAVVALASAIRAASATFRINRVLLASHLGQETLSGFVEELRSTLEAQADSRIPLPEISMDTVSPSPCARGTAMLAFFKAFGVSDAGMFAPQGQRSVA